MLPQVAAATALVTLVPVGLVWWLRVEAIVTSVWLCAALAIVASAVLAAAGTAYWKRREGSERVVFSELLVWTWIRRTRLERKLASVVELVGGAQARAEREEPGSDRRGELLRALAVALDAQDPYTEGHSRRVARHAAMVARELHLPGDEVERVRAAAAVHDVGKLRVPAALLSKPGKLTPEEFEVVKRHAADGAALVACLEDDGLTAIVRHHHERFDGRGYPAGLSGVEIPLGARIVAVADTFDAITSIRSYRSAASHKQALDRLAEVAGTQLDPAAVRAFLRYYAGGKGSVAWVGLAVVPQRLVAWMRGHGSAAGNFTMGGALATIGSAIVVGVAAMATAASVGVQRETSRAGSPSLLAQRTHLSAGGTASSGGSSLAGPGSAANGPVGPRGATAAAYAARGAGRPRVAYILLHALHASGPAAGSHRGPAARPGSRSVTTTTAAGRSGAGSGAPTPHSGQSHAPGGGRHRAGGGSGPGQAGGSESTQPVGTGAAPSGVPAPALAAPTSPASTSPTSPAAPPAPAPSGAPGTPASPAPSSSGSSGVASGAPQSVPSGPPPVTGPTSKDQCKGGGFAQWGFRNQGQCIASVNGQ